MGPEMLANALDGVELGHEAQSERQKLEVTQENVGKGKNRHILHHFKITRFSGVEGNYTSDIIEDQAEYKEFLKYKNKKKKRSCGCWAWLKRP